MEVCIPKEKNITMKMGSEMVEDEMFIGSVFCNVLSGSQKKSEGTQHNQDIKLQNERFGIATNHE